MIHKKTVTIILPQVYVTEQVAKVIMNLAIQNNRVTKMVSFFHMMLIPPMSVEA